MAYSKQTWDTTSYVNPTRMNHIEQGIYDVSESLKISVNDTRFFISKPMGIGTANAVIPFSGAKPASVSVTDVAYFSGSSYTSLTVNSSTIMDNCILIECTAPSGMQQGANYWAKGKIVASYS